MGIKNLNAEKISKLSQSDIKSLNVVFEKNYDVLDFFGHNLI